MHRQASLGTLATISIRVVGSRAHSLDSVSMKNGASGSFFGIGRPGIALFGTAKFAVKERKVATMFP